MEENLRQVIEMGALNGSVYVVRGDSLVRRGRLREALAEYQEAMRIDEYRVGRSVAPKIAKLKALLHLD